LILIDGSKMQLTFRFLNWLLPSCHF